MPYRKFRKGYNRTGGYYGRFRGPHAEKKFKDSAQSSVVITTAGLELFSTLVTVAQGDLETSRDGRQCLITDIHFRMHIFMPVQSLTSNEHDFVRFVVVLDKQCNGAAPAIDDIIESADIDAFRSLEHSRRFRTLYDKTHSFWPTAGCGNGTTNFVLYNDRYFQINLTPPGGILMEYDTSASTGVISTRTSNNIFVWAISKHAIARIAGRARIRFYG